MKREIVAALGLVSQTPIEHLRVFMDQDKPQDTAAFITGMRNECMAICSDFAPYASKVLLPLRLIGEVGGLIRDDGLTPTDLQREKAEETVCYCHCSSILSAWALNKTVCAYPPRELQGLIANDWWRDYTTDFVIEQFKPWSVFFTLEGVAHPKGKEAIFGGMYAGFTVTNGRLKLYCQHALKGKLPHFMLYHEFDMTKGQTLGQVCDNYRFESPLVEMLRRHYDAPGQEVSEDDNLPFEESMRLTGQAIAGRLFPMMVGMISDSFYHRYYTFDSSSQTVDEGIVERDARADIKPGDVVKALQDSTVQIVVTHFEAQDMTNLQ